MDRKFCNYCLLEKPVADFSKRGHRPSLNSFCRECGGQRYGHFKTEYKKTKRGYFTKLATKAKRRALDQKVPYDVTADYLEGLYDAQRGRCALSGREMTFTGTDMTDRMSVDKIVPKLGYVPGNVQLVSYACNVMKWSLPMDLFAEIIAQVHNTLDGGN